MIFIPLETEMNTKHIQTLSLQPYYISILPVKTSAETADRLLQCSHAFC